VIVVPKGAASAPILLERTPYNASARGRPHNSPHMLAALPESAEVFVAGGYICVFQDVRGKYGSEGDYLMTRPSRPVELHLYRRSHRRLRHHRLAGEERPRVERPRRHDRLLLRWLTVVMALLEPHPALKVAAPESPMVDGWMGDDWFHYGAFRQTNLDYTAYQTTVRAAASRSARSLRRLRDFRAPVRQATMRGRTSRSTPWGDK